MEAGRRTLSTAAANRTLLGGGRHVDLSRLPVESVADAPHRHDLERRAPGELLTQPANVNVDGLALACELTAPHVLEQGIACMNATRERQQVWQEVELAGRQLDVRTVQDHSAR